IHYVSPSVWAWRRDRIGTIARSVDHLLALFPFEPPLYADAGIRVTFVGHPLAASAATAASRREARELLKFEMGTPVFALLPGSRMSELEMHTELLLKTAAALFEAQPLARFVVPLVSRAAREYFERVQYRLQLESLSLKLLYGHASDALRAADVGIVASGTATLEAAMARCPHLVFYKVHPVTAEIVKRKLLLPFVGLPNILAGRFVAPEFLQWEATVDNLSRGALNLYDDVVTRRRTEALFASLADSLMADGATIAAEAAVILDPQRKIKGLRDSKLLTPDSRVELAVIIRARAVAWAVAHSDVGEIDALNILQATLLAMKRAIEQLTTAPEVVWIDGNQCPPLDYPSRAIVDGDRLVAAIAAASILAKTTRDAMLVDLDRSYPLYGFA